MKYILAILLLCPLLSLSQDTVKVPTHAAKSIVKDLISCDSLKAVHAVTVEELDLTKEKVNVQSKIITAHIEKGIMYEQRIVNEKEKFRVQGMWVQDLRKQNKKLKVELGIVKVAAILISGGLTYLYITK